MLAKAHQFLTFTTPPNLQTAVAWGLANSADWFAAMPRDLTRSRDRPGFGRLARTRASPYYPAKAPTS